MYHGMTNFHASRDPFTNIGKKNSLQSRLYKHHLTIQTMGRNGRRVTKTKL